MKPIHPVNHPTAVVLLILTAMFWSMGGLLIKTINMNPVALAGLRSFIAGSFILILTWRRLDFIWTPTQWCTAFAYMGTVVLFISATKLTSAANAILLQYTAPVYVAIFSHWFLRERIRPMDWLVILLVLVGMGVFFLDRLSAESSLGNALAVLSGVSFAWLTLFLRKQKGRSTMESVILGNFLTFFMTLPWIFQVHSDPASWMRLGIMGVLQLGLPYFLYAIAIRSVSALEGILIPVIEPVLNPVWVALFYGEKPTLYSIAGGALVIGAITARGLFGLARSASRSKNLL